MQNYIEGFDKMKKNNEVNINSNEIEKICPAGFAKSIFAYLIDAAIVIICIFLSYLSLTDYFVNKFDVVNAKIEGRSFYEDSGLVFFDENNAVRSYLNLSDVYDENSTPYFQILEEKVWYYYVEFLPLDTRCDFSEISETKNQDVAKNYVYKTIYSISDDGSGNKYFEPSKKEDGTLDFSKEPVLKASYQEGVKNKDNTILVELLDAFNNSESGYYTKALNNLTDKQNYIVSRINRINNAQFYTLLPGSIVFPTVFFILIPLINKKGRTLGKMMFKLELVSSVDNKPAKLWQKFVHYGFILAYWLLILVSKVWIIMILAIFASIIDYMVRILNRKFQSFHDIAAHTIVIDTKKTEYKVLINDEVITDEEDVNQSWEDAYIHKASKAKKEAEEDERLYKILDMSTLEESNKVKEEWRKEDNKEDSNDKK